MAPLLRLALAFFLVGAGQPGVSRCSFAAESQPVNGLLSGDDRSDQKLSDEGKSLSGNRSDFATVMWRPVFAASLGILVVLLLMIKLKVHAFVALILGALAISCSIPLDVTGFNRNVKDEGAKPHVVRGVAEPVNVVTRVTTSLGSAVAGIGILIAMASIIGKCMLVSGAADRIVQSLLNALGERRAPIALMASGFVLSIPVFFDTVFYLLVPLARSLYRRTGKNYVLYLCAIAAGGAVTHTLVPPTPGPLLVAETMRVDIGPVILIGLCVAAPTALIGLIAAGWLNRQMPIVMRPLSVSLGRDEPVPQRQPSLILSLLPVLLPVMLISISTFYKAIVGDGAHSGSDAISGWLKLIGDPNLAMITAALVAIFLCWKFQGHSLRQLADHVEDALLSGGVIILITAAGGAFGNLLAMAEIQSVVESFFVGDQTVSGGWLVICLAFALAALLKVAQGSSTVSMIIASSLISPIALSLAAEGRLGFHVAYLVAVIGAGSLMGSWMNDSGFWVFAKMGALTEGETLRSWTILLAVLSSSAFVFILLMSWLFPLV
jgi:GntP family gluconate:H+ symporter